MKEIKAYYPKDFLARQGTTFAELSTRLNDVATQFEETLSNTNPDLFYEATASGKWSPAEIADHVVKANELFIRALETPMKGGEIIQMTRGRVTDDGRPISPQEEEPRPDRERADLARDFTTTVAELANAAQKSDEAGKLSKTCIHQSFFGPMTGLELLQLAAWHVRHHEKQLPNFER